MVDAGRFCPVAPYEAVGSCGGQPRPLLNEIVLIGMSVGAYLSAASPLLTALISSGFGAALLACAQEVKAENTVIVDIAVLLTLVVFMVRNIPLLGANKRRDILGIKRVVAMKSTCVLAKVRFNESPGMTATLARRLLTRDNV